MIQREWRGIDGTTGLVYWTHEPDGSLPLAQLDRPFLWAISQRATSIHTYSYKEKKTIYSFLVRIRKNSYQLTDCFDRRKTKICWSCNSLEMLIKEDFFFFFFTSVGTTGGPGIVWVIFVFVVLGLIVFLRELRVRFPLQMDIFCGSVAKGCLTTDYVHLPPAGYTASLLLTLYQHRANNQYRTPQIKSSRILGLAAVLRKQLNNLPPKC